MTLIDQRKKFIQKIYDSEQTIKSKDQYILKLKNIIINDSGKYNKKILEQIMKEDVLDDIKEAGTDEEYSQSTLNP